MREVGSPHQLVLVLPFSRSSAQQQLRLLCTAYEAVQRPHVPLSAMLQAMERVVLPLAKRCSTTAIGDFFVSNISDMSAVLLSRFSKVCLLQLGRDLMCF